jgi:hypothetical protein
MVIGPTLGPHFFFFRLWYYWPFLNTESSRKITYFYQKKINKSSNTCSKGMELDRYVHFYFLYSRTLILYSQVSVSTDKIQ